MTRTRMALALALALAAIGIQSDLAPALAAGCSSTCAGWNGSRNANTNPPVMTQSTNGGVTATQPQTQGTNGGATTSQPHK